MSTASTTSGRSVGHGRRAGIRRRRILSYVVMTILAVVFLFPLVFMFVSSLKPDSEILRDVSLLMAFVAYGDISLDNYRGNFDRVPVWRFLGNSILVTVTTVGLGLFVNSLAGFALSRLRWRGRGLVLAFVIATLIVPLSGPAFATVAILTFLAAWNQYLWPLMVVQQEELRPVMIGMQYFFQLDTAWGEIMAYTSLITLPVLVVFLIFQRQFIASVAVSGVKG